jgi:FeS assembly SUF system regulator
MIRLSKLTDYGIVLMTRFAVDGAVHTARELADDTGVPLPTVSKVLKALAREELLLSHRGVKGGYSLSRPAQEISVAQIISAFEQIAMTECTSIGLSCELEPTCPVRGNWQKIGQAIRNALQDLSLADMTSPLPVVTARTSRGQLISSLSLSGKVQ